jgi:hypothetical protein
MENDNPCPWMGKFWRCSINVIFDAMGHPCTIASLLSFLTCVFHFIDFYIFILFRIKGKCCSHVRIFLWDVVPLTFAWLYFIYAWIYFYLREGEKTLVSWPSPPFDIHLMKMSQVYSFCSFWSSLELLRWAHVLELEPTITPHIHFIAPYIFSLYVIHHLSRLCISLNQDEPKVWLYLYSCIVLGHA